MSLVAYRYVRSGAPARIAKPLKVPSSRLGLYQYYAARHDKDQTNTQALHLATWYWMLYAAFDLEEEHGPEQHTDGNHDHSAAAQPDSGTGDPGAGRDGLVGRHNNDLFPYRSRREPSPATQTEEGA